MQLPKVIFLDAVGTLFGVKGSVGEVYAEIAYKYGVQVSPEVLNQAFIRNFKASSPPVFPDAELADIPQCEFDWWKSLAIQTFQEAGVIQQFFDFGVFFGELYDHFATSQPWVIYPDVLPALQHWRNLGIQLGVVSNFDSRLYSVLQSLGLVEFFDSITISTQVGTAKPDPEIFTIGLHKHDCTASVAWHIGDSITEDYKGAKAAGLRGIWINRS